MIKIMVVEDEPAAMNFIISLIQTRCADLEIVAKAEDGTEAVEILKTTHVDILITDVQMTHMNGVELAHWVSSSKPDVITVIISGHSEFEYAKGALQAGVVEYLLKPINPSDFVVTMEKMYQLATQNRRSRRENWLKKAAAGSIKQTPFPELNPDDAIIIGVLILGSSRTALAATADEAFPYVDCAKKYDAAIYIHRGSEICFAIPAAMDVSNTKELIACLSEDTSYHTALYKTVKANEGDLLRDMIRAACKIVTPGISQISEFSGELQHSVKRQGESGELISDIETYIREHLDEPLPVQRICDIFGISTSYLSQLFRKHIKMSFVEYVTSLRIEEAKRIMIEHPEIAIKDIAARLGFSDQFYFSKVFRTATGMPPSEYGKRN
jgi:two-component system response regulator YesN